MQKTPMCPLSRTAMSISLRLVFTESVISGGPKGGMDSYIGRKEGLVCDVGYARDEKTEEAVGRSFVDCFFLFFVGDLYFIGWQADV